MPCKNWLLVALHKHAQNKPKGVFVKRKDSAVERKIGLIFHVAHLGYVCATKGVHDGEEFYCFDFSCRLLSLKPTFFSLRKRKKWIDFSKLRGISISRGVGMQDYSLPQKQKSMEYQSQGFCTTRGSHTLSDCHSCGREESCIQSSLYWRKSNHFFHKLSYRTKSHKIRIISPLSWNHLIR